MVDLSSHNTNPPGVFDGEAVPLSDVADTRIEESVALFGSREPPADALPGFSLRPGAEIG
jgi:hypothetical protein